jgi:hypothetical protein
MATEEEIYAIIMRIDNEEKVKELSGDLAKAEQKLRDVVVAGGKMSQSAKDWGGEVAKLSSQLKAAESGSGLAAHKVMQLGQTLDDLQYVGEQGLRPIINNIMQMSPALGIAMIGFQLLWTHADKLSNLFAQGETKTEAERMKELGEKTEKTADEMERLSKYQRERKNIQEQETSPTNQQSAQSKKVNEALIEAPIGKVDELIKDMLRQGVTNASPEKEQLDDVRKAIKNPSPMIAGNDMATLLQRQAELTAAIEKKVEDAARAFRGKLTEEPLALQSFISKLEPHSELAKSLKEAAKTPEDLEFEKEDEYYRKQNEASNNAKQGFYNQGHDAEVAKGKADDEAERLRNEAQASRLVQFQEESRHKAESSAAGQLGQGVLGRRAATGELNEGDVRSGLLGLGNSQKEVDEIAAGVFDLLKTRGDEAAKKRAGELGMTIEQARKQLKHDQMEPIGQAFEQYGGSIMDIQKQAQDAMRNKTSQVIGTAGLADSIQASVGAKDPQLKTVEELQKANEILAKILAKPENQALMLNR